MTEELNENVVNELTKLQPIINQTMVQYAVIRALIETHPNPDRVRQVTESLLTQAQGNLALSDEKQPRLLSAEIQPILDSLFRPPINLES